MPGDPPNVPPNVAAEAAEPAAPEPAAAEPAAAEPSAPAGTPEPSAPAVPPEPVSKVKEWAVAVAIMVVFAIICAQFIGFLRSNQLGGP